MRKNASKFRDKILELTRENPFLTGSEIAEKVGCCRAMVNLTHRAEEISLNDLRHQVIVNYLNENEDLSLAQVALHFDITYSNVRIHALSVGITTIRIKERRKCTTQLEAKQFALKALLENGTFRDAVVGEVLGYSRERVRQVREAGNYITISSKESLEDAA